MNADLKPCHIYTNLYVLGCIKAPDTDYAGDEKESANFPCKAEPECSVSVEACAVLCAETLRKYFWGSSEIVPQNHPTKNV